MQSGMPPRAGIIAPNDLVALGFREAALEQGLKAGIDYALVGFDDRARKSNLQVCGSLGGNRQ